MIEIKVGIVLIALILGLTSCAHQLRFKNINDKLDALVARECVKPDVKRLFE